MVIFHLDEITSENHKLVGGKTFSLAILATAGHRIPKTLCITTEAYNKFIRATGLHEKIQLEINRKPFSAMRWEEIWDAALRIRNMFLRTPMISDLREILLPYIETTFAEIPLVIRSSAPEEDTSSTSFAGLHESYVNIKGTDAIIHHIKLVWASLWSDAALLYRQELGLDVGKSSMAVLLQELIPGESSGIIFTASPNDQKQMVIESVHGLNQALVDGDIEPDRWIIDKKTNSVISHSTAMHQKIMVADDHGIALQDLPANKVNNAPLDKNKIQTLIKAANEIETLFQKPQDIEWTFLNDDLTILQSRPITTTIQASDTTDKRPWYLSLHRSFDNLQKLQKNIEEELIPAILQDADKLAAMNLQNVTDAQLANEIEARQHSNEKWSAVYWEEFIPFAHGMRLFGQTYNDIMQPENPYEFLELLVKAPLESVKRNKMLHNLSERLLDNKKLQQQVMDGKTSDFDDPSFNVLLEEFLKIYGDLSCTLETSIPCKTELKTLLSVILESAKGGPSTLETPPAIEIKQLENNFLKKFPGDTAREKARQLLDLGRASYRLRDDDNIILGKIENELTRALVEGKRRLVERNHIPEKSMTPPYEIIQSLNNPSYKIKVQDRAKKQHDPVKSQIKPRQLLGQPAGPGLAKGPARIVLKQEDLSAFKKNEILVCDAVEPNMTFVVPLAAGIVERRGGMLIHGAIIAREYGIACVTGIEDATSLIHNGDNLTVDGYLGIVTIGKPDITDSQ